MPAKDQRQRWGKKVRARCEVRAGNEAGARDKAAPGLNLGFVHLKELNRGSHPHFQLRCVLNGFIGGGPGLGVVTLFLSMDSFRVNKTGGGREAKVWMRWRCRGATQGERPGGNWGPRLRSRRAARHTHQKMVANFMLRQSSAKSSKRTLSISWKRLSSASQSVCKPGGIPTPSSAPAPTGRVAASAGVPMFLHGWQIPGTRSRGPAPAKSRRRAP